jgi:phosphatidylserine decarboxylase
MCREHFTELPTSAIEVRSAILHGVNIIILIHTLQDSKYMSRKLEETTVLFKGTPISDSLASLGLRRAKVFHLIAALICDKIWQPLFISALWDSPEIRSFLVRISATLLKTDHQRESVWRYTALNTVKQTHQPETVPKAFLEHLIREVAPKFRPLLPDSKVIAVEEDLRRILIDAIEFWETTQRDGSRISVSTIPTDIKTSWEEALPFVMPDEDLQKTSPSPSRSRGFDPLLVFPEVIRQSRRKYSAASSKDNIHEDETPRTLSRGLALFANTNIFDFGVEEQEALAEATKQAHFRVSSHRKRSSLTTRPETLLPSLEKTDVPDA